MKINLGCGADYRSGWLNVDQHESANPDMVIDLEKTPWPLESDCADTILLKHVLQTLGRDTQSFLAVMSELYRVAKPDATIEIHVPHPMHADFMGDPTHIRPVTPEMFQCFDLGTVEKWQAANLPGTPLARQIGVDFETVSVEHFPDLHWATLLARGEIDSAGIFEKARSSLNVIQWMRIILRARKPFRQGRSLDGYGAVCLERYRGLGDALLAVGAAKALKDMTGKPIYLATAEHFRSLMETCPSLDGIVSGEPALAALKEQYASRGGLLHIDLQNVTFGISANHQIDAYLHHLGLAAPPAAKEIVLDATLGEAEARAFLAELPRLAKGGKRILVHPAVGDVNRTWPKEKWTELCGRLRDDGHQVILLGMTGRTPGIGIHDLSDIPGIFSAVDRLSLPAELALMNASDVLISTDNGPVQLAGASTIHIICIHTVTAARMRKPYRRGVAGWKYTPVTPACEYSPCYPKIFDGNALAKGALVVDNQLLIGLWCPAGTGYDCVINQIAVDDVVEAFRAV